MSQSDFGTIVASTKSGTTLASDLNSWRTAVHSGHSGTSRPSYAVAGMTWTNTSTNPYVVYFYDGTDDIAIGSINTTTNIFTPADNSAGTTGGTSTAFTYTPAVPSTGNLINQEYDITFHTAAGTTPTLSVSGQTALAVKYRDYSGTLQAIDSSTTPSGWRSRVVNDGTYWVQREIANVQPYDADIPTISASQTEMVVGTESALRSMSPLRVAQAIVALSSSVQGAFKNLQASANGTNANVSISYDEISLEDTSNSYVTARSGSLTVDTSTSGANGLDTGTIASSTWYSVWVIRKPDATTAGLISASATSPTMPSGYTFKARVGWIRTDGTANKYPLGFTQKGKRVRYLVSSGSNLTAMPQMATGASGDVSIPTWTSLAWANFAPPTAAYLSLAAIAINGILMVAPNNSYGAYNSTTNPPPLNNAFNSASSICTLIADITPETSNVYYACANAGQIYMAGWEDNL